jgi:hypothetical protein
MPALVQRRPAPSSLGRLRPIKRVLGWADCCDGVSRCAGMDRTCALRASPAKSSASSASRFVRACRAAASQARMQRTSLRRTGHDMSLNSQTVHAEERHNRGPKGTHRPLRTAAHAALVSRRDARAPARSNRSQSARRARLTPRASAASRAASAAAAAWARWRSRSARSASSDATRLAAAIRPCTNVTHGPLKRQTRSCGASQAVPAEVQ